MIAQFFKNSKKNKLFYIIVSLFFGLIFSFKFIKLSILNFELNGFLNFTSNMSIDDINNSQDLTMIFSWARRSIENMSIFELGSNLSGVENKYHHFSSRGFGLFILGSPLLLFNSPINSITFIYILFGFINFYLISSYFKKLGPL